MEPCTFRYRASCDDRVTIATHWSNQVNNSIRYHVFCIDYSIQHVPADDCWHSVRCTGAFLLRAWQVQNHMQHYIVCNIAVFYVQWRCLVHRHKNSGIQVVTIRSFGPLGSTGWDAGAVGGFQTERSCWIRVPQLSRTRAQQENNTTCDVQSWDWTIVSTNRSLKVECDRHEYSFVGSLVGYVHWIWNLQPYCSYRTSCFARMIT